MKRIIIAFLSGIAFITPTIIASTMNFPDVKSSDWFYNDVEKMVEWDVIRGNADGTFKPANNVNRAELSAMWNRYNEYTHCELIDSINAERAYVYPILRELGYNPDDYGKDIKNPITTNYEYAKNCN